MCRRITKSTIITDCGGNNVVRSKTIAYFAKCVPTCADVQDYKDHTASVAKDASGKSKLSCGEAIESKQETLVTLATGPASKKSKQRKKSRDFSITRYKATRRSMTSSRSNTRCGKSTSTVRAIKEDRSSTITVENANLEASEGEKCKTHMRNSRENDNYRTVLSCNVCLTPSSGTSGGQLTNWIADDIGVKQPLCGVTMSHFYKLWNRSPRTLPLGRGKTDLPNGFLRQELYRQCGCKTRRHEFDTEQKRSGHCASLCL